MDIYTQIGEEIKNKRQLMSVSVEKIAADLYLKPQYILDVENGLYDEVNSHTYYIGYVCLLSRYLGLDEELFMKKLNLLENLSEKKPNATSFIKAEEDSDKNNVYIKQNTKNEIDNRVKALIAALILMILYLVSR
jgi:cytoskeletal protein RodZ